VPKSVRFQLEKLCVGGRAGRSSGRWVVVSTETRLIVERKHTNVAVYCSTDWQQQISRRYISCLRPALLWINNGFNVLLPGLGPRLVHVSVARLTRQRLPRWPSRE